MGAWQRYQVTKIMGGARHLPCLRIAVTERRSYGAVVADSVSAADVPFASAANSTISAPDGEPCAVKKQNKKNFQLLYETFIYILHFKMKATLLSLDLVPKPPSS